MTQRADSLHVDLAGTPFEVTTDDPRILPLLLRLWEPFLTPRREDTAMQARVCVTEGPRPFFQFENEEPVRGSDLWTALYLARLHLVQRALDKATETRVYLHSAVLERDGRGLLLIGPYDSGKTTFSIALLRRGWRLLSDDVTLIDPSGLTIEWFPKPLGIKRGNWDDLKDLWDPEPAWLPRPSGAFLIPATGFPLSRRVDDVRQIVFLAFNESQPETREHLSAARAVALAGEYSAHPNLETLRTLSAIAEAAETICLFSHKGDADAVKGLLSILERESSGLRGPSSV